MVSVDLCVSAFRNWPNLLNSDFGFAKSREGPCYVFHCSSDLASLQIHATAGERGGATNDSRMILVSLSRGSGAGYARCKCPGQIGDRMQSGLSRKPWRAIAKGNSHDQGQCGFFQRGWSRTQGLALLEHDWKWWGAAASNLLDASEPWLPLEIHCRHVGPCWTLFGISTLGKKSCLNTGHCLACDHLLDILSPYLLTFPFSSLPIHFFIPFCSSLFPPPIYPFSYFLFCDDFIFSVSLYFLSVPSFSFQMYAKGIKVFPCISSSCTWHVGHHCLMSESVARSVWKEKVM